MPELQELLVHEIERRPDDLPDFSDVLSRAHRHARTRRLATLVTAAPVLLIVLGLGLGWSLTRPVAQQAANGTAVIEDSGVNFRHPEPWKPYRFTGVASLDAGGGQVIVHLSTENVPNPCRVSVTEGQRGTSCADLDVQLQDSGALVTWAMQSGRVNSSPLDVVAGNPRVFAGHNSVLWSGPASSACRANGGARQMQAYIDMPQDDRSHWLTMTACLASPYDRAEQQVLDMLDSLVITP